MSSATTTPPTPSGPIISPTDYVNPATAPAPTGVSGSWTPDQPLASHPLWQRIKDWGDLPEPEYEKKYAADDAATKAKVNSVLGHIIPFFNEAAAVQPVVEQNKYGKQAVDFAKEQLSHPEQFAMGGEFGGEVVPEKVVSGAEKAAENLAETGKTAVEGLVKEGKAAINAKAPEGSAEAGAIPLSRSRVYQGALSPTDVRELRNYWEPRGGNVTTETGVGGAAGRKGFLHTYLTLPEKTDTEIPNQVESAAAPALAKPAPVDFTKVGGTALDRRAPDSFGRTPGTTMKKVTDATYQAMRENGVPTAAPETAETPSGKFTPVNGVELRQPTTFGRTGGSFGKTVDQTYDTLRAQEKPVEVSNQVESNKSQLPPQPKLPDTGTYAAIKTDDGSIYPDTEPEKQRTHIMLAQDLGIPADRIVSGGWLKDGDYEGSERSDAGRYGERARAQKAVDEKRTNISNQVESNVTAPAIHPDLQKLSDKYGVSDDPEKVRNGASFIRPDGQFIHLPGIEHNRAIENVTGVMDATKDNRPDFLSDTGAVRTRFHMGRGGQTLSVSVPKEGVNEEQISALKEAFRTSMDGGRGNLVMEVGTPNGKSTQADYVTANEIEPALARIGAMPNQRVNLSDAYGDTGTYIGGHVPSYADQVRARSRAANWDAQAKGAPEGVTNRQRYTENLGVTHGPELLETPKDRLGESGTSETLMHHEVAHVVAAHLLGLPVEGVEIRSHLHPELKDTGAAGAAYFDFSKLPGATMGADGKKATLPISALVDALPKLLHLYMAGGAGEQLIDGTSMLTNAGMGGDLNAAEKVARAAGLSRPEANYRIRKAMMDIKNTLDTPEILDIIKNASKTREEGLPKTLLMSKERVQRDIIQKLNEVTSGKRTDNIDTSAGDTAGTVRSADQGIGEAASSREGQVSGGAAGGNESAAVQGSLFSKKVKQNPEMGFISPEGKFEGPIKGEVTHPDMTQRLTEGESDEPQTLIAQGWVRKAGQGAYQVGTLTPETQKTIENDILADYRDLTGKGKFGKKELSVVIATNDGEYEFSPKDFVEKYNGDLGKAIRDVSRKTGISNQVESSKAVAAKEEEPEEIRIERPEGDVLGTQLKTNAHIREWAKEWGVDQKTILDHVGGQRVAALDEITAATKGKGYGNTLLKSFEKQARDGGADSIVLLSANEHNAKGFDLTSWYKRNGYTQIGEQKLHPDDVGKHPGYPVMVKKLIDPKTYDKIVDLHNQNGGATWNLAQNKSLSGTDNYAVATHPDRTLTVKGELTPEIVKSFAEKNADLLKDPTESLGTWNDKANNQHVLDVVKTIPDRAEAVRLGFEHKQDAIYDLKKTDGTGEIFMKDEKSPGKQNPPVGWFKPDGTFQKAEGGHPKSARNMNTTVSDLLKQGWVRKAGQGSYEGTLNSDTHAAVESDLLHDYPDMKEESPSFQSIVLDEPGGKTSKEIPLSKFVDSGFDLRKSGIIPSAPIPLPEDYQAKVAAIRQTHGDNAAFNEVAQYLKPEEREEVTKVLKRNVLDQFAKLPPMEDFEEAAKAGEIQKGWYKNTATVLKDVFGTDTGLFTNIVAALSPLKAVRENFRDALEFYADWVEAGKPTDGRKLENLTTKKFMGTYAQNLQRAVKGEDVSGPKVSNFSENLKGNLDEITKDRWMSFFKGNPKGWSSHQISADKLAFDAAMRRTAEKLGWDPAEVQETIWSFVKSVVESSEKEGVTPSEKAKSLTDTEVREGAGSFANLIKDPKIAASFERVADATGDNRFRPESVQSSKGYRKAQRATPAPKGEPVRGSADILGRVAERANKAARFNTLQKGISALGEEREPGDEN